MTTRSRPLLFGALAAGAAWFAWGRLREPPAPQHPPFALWAFHAGRSFASIDSQALAEQGRRFECQPIVGPTKLCEIATTGIAGRLRAVVDSSGIAVLVQFRVDSADVVMREEGRRIAAEWSLASAATEAEKGNGRDGWRTRKWASADGRWTATMRRRGDEPTPRLVAVADEHGMSRLRDAVPTALMVLAANELIDEEEIDPASMERSALGLAGGAGAAPASADEMRPVAPPLARLARCDAVPPDFPMPANGAREELGEELASLLERAVPMATPGATLVFGERIYLVDADGLAERISVYPAGEDDESHIRAFVVRYPRRAELAKRRIESRSAQCRAADELLLVGIGRDGRPAEAVRFVLDEDAPISEIGRASFDYNPDPNGRPILRVTAGSTFATERWVGEVQWEAIVATDPPRVTARTPVAYAIQARGGEPARGGHLTITGHLPGAWRLATMDVSGRNLATQAIVLPVPAGSMPSGWELLHRF